MPRSKYGSSLAFLSKDGTKGTNAAQTLESTTIHSGVELAIFTDQRCNETAPEVCGLSRSEDVAFRMPCVPKPAGSHAD